VLTIRCAACRRKLWKYEKLGRGEVLRCHKARIPRMYAVEWVEEKLRCPCGQVVAIDKGPYYKMVKKGFVYSGMKRN
jgi:hypothetical protein